MKKTIILICILFSFASIASAECFGWVLKYKKTISITETLCVYEKSGVQQKFIVNGFCPMSPPGC